MMTNGPVIDVRDLPEYLREPTLLEVDELGDMISINSLQRKQCAESTLQRSRK
jgi:hypothetical protein